MISDSVEFSIAGGGANEKHERKCGAFFSSPFFPFFFHIIYSLLRYKKLHGALAMAKTKPKIQNELSKETSGTKKPFQLGSVPVPGPHTGPKLNQVNQRKPSLH